MNPKIQNPYLNALIPIGGVALLGIFTSILTWGLAAFGVIERSAFWISLIISGFFCLIWLIILLLGARKVKKIRGFLNSDRPLIRWTYSPEDWKRIKELDWNEQRQDWKLQWGCMSLLIAAAGGLTGAMLGLGEGFGLILVNILLGLLVGAAIGLLLGAVVAGGNHLDSWLAYRKEEPAQVALGPGEIYTGFDYFHADGKFRFIKDYELNSGKENTLTITLIFPPRPRTPNEETWIIPVPDHLVEHIDRIIPELRKSPIND
jgi:hypothetical protein